MHHTPANEPAFPRPASNQQPGDRVEPQYAQDGMTMREWFAGQALAGLLACPDLHRTLDAISNSDPAPVFRTFAGMAFLAADAMIAQAKKEPTR
jgi:hypothetical protein